ncbi:heme ABC exporter ATP-binding protein CcmA [Thiomicrospira sp. WB1]|uniref:heme ABC exporter ATP-binding protein CcmA n=1 Tax=Thiomicrospira sp. WB1 TaxID=1685380 RepID=UPI00074653B5|nr:heme ABC exporter ATP-binding protein CcmA [Thiomicrospira sp. WB1]KUJ71729.1 hypothetical protein AVO41_04460 [Thiomicrospira sp. WB1]
MIQVEGLSLSRDNRRLLESVGFSLSPGQMLWLKGANGIGKSSLLAALAGILPIDQANVSLDRQPQSFSELTRRIAWLGDQAPIKAGWTLLDNLAYLSRFYASTPVSTQTMRHALKGQGLEALREVSANTLSFGQRQRLLLTAFSLNDRPVWLLDEPGVGLDDAARARLSSLLLDALEAGKMILMTSHDPFWCRLEALNERCTVLNLASFSPTEARSRVCF